jgi:hypothetical protein
MAVAAREERFGHQLGPGDGVQHQESERDDVEQNHQRMPHVRLERRVGLGAARQRANLEQRYDQEVADEDAGELAQDELQVVETPEPPPVGKGAVIFARLELRVRDHRVTCLPMASGMICTIPWWR